MSIDAADWLTQHPSPWKNASSIRPSAFTAVETCVNDGLDPAAASATRLYLSVNAVLDDGDLELGAGRAVAALAPGASDSGTSLVTIPAGTAPGTYFAIAQADAGDSVPESRETNNALIRVIRVTAP